MSYESDQDRLDRVEMRHASLSSALAAMSNRLESIDERLRDMSTTLVNFITTSNAHRRDLEQAVKDLVSLNASVSAQGERIATSLEGVARLSGQTTDHVLRLEKLLLAPSVVGDDDE